MDTSHAPTSRATRGSRARFRLLGVVATSLLVALLAAVVAHVTVKPVAVAATHVFVDTPSPSVVHRPAYPVSALVQRAELFGRVMTSPPVARQIARIAHVPPGQLAARARITTHVPAVYTEPGSEERASEIVTEERPYRIEVEARQETPVLDVYTHAPSTAAAVRLANAAVVGLERQLRALSEEDGVGAGDQVALRQLGTARGGVVNAGMSTAIAVITFIVVFAMALLALRFLAREPRPSVRRELPADAPSDAWPHTSRLTPWTFAVFLAVVWLTPFSDILLKVGAPIDLTFDRLVLPFVLAVWVLAALVDGGTTPRVTRIHTAVGVFTLCAFLGVILNAGTLNQTLELDGAVKRLPLLITYVCVFAIGSTAIRSTEVRAFLTYTLVLGVICALGILWEYRFKQNLFYQWSDKLLPGTFEIGKVDPSALDDIGRRVTSGPALVPLEAVAMLAMALAIPLVRLMQAERPRQRVIYGLAACLLFAAAFATFRKSALVVPLSVIGTLAYFRRRELLKLAPLGVVVVVLIPVLAPGAVGMTTSQFQPSRLGVSTVSDRSSDYDALRPDLWSHLLMGRGWGSYDHATYRTLDSEILHRLVEGGVLGLLAFLFMIGSVVWASRKTIAQRDPTWAPLALIGAAAAVSFGVASTLFDVMAFPHAVYIFLYMAGLAAAVLARDTTEPRFAPVRHASAHGGQRRQDEAGPPSTRAPVLEPVGSISS